MNSNYSLDQTCYSWKNALLWGNAYCHLKEIKQGQLGQRAIHLFIGLIELPPLIGQIISIFELIIAKKNPELTLPLFNPSIPNSYPIEEIKNFKVEMLANLSKHVENERVNPTYQRAKLVPLSSKDTRINQPIVLNQAPEGIEKFAKDATFYAYDAEGIEDHGWGCAWRAMQTCLSAYGLNKDSLPTNFETLFHLFGPLKNLTQLYRDKFPEKELKSDAKFAPYELNSGWAEPFIGELALHFYGIEAQLETVNGIPGCYAPASVFPEESLDFAEFRERLQTHFEQEVTAPLMIDDGTYTANIIGLGLQEEQTILWIADPHIKRGANSQEVNLAKTKGIAVGLYCVTLDQTGKQVTCSLDSISKKQVEEDYPYASYRVLNFNDKKWMVLFPN